MNKSIKKAKQADISGADISAFRRRIDDIDEQILGLISRRLSTAQAIGKIKQQTGITVVDNRREAEIYRRLLSLNPGALKTGSLYRIFRSIIAAGRGVQYRQSGAAEPPLAAHDDPGDDDPRGTESVTRVGQ